MAGGPPALPGFGAAVDDCARTKSGQMPSEATIANKGIRDDRAGRKCIDTEMENGKMTENYSP
jgi:hypothetical protein